MPILCSTEPQVAVLRVPTSPLVSGMNLGTTNKLMPLLPAGASGSLASTKCTMFSVRSCSPAVMKILVPVMAYEPSPLGLAFVRKIPKSVPA